MFIEICGGIASGKTSLSKTLALQGLLPVYENFQDNPFWRAFYENPTGCSFETELTFLLQHYHSIKQAPRGKTVICDFSLLQDMAYADVNLAGERHRIFCELEKELRAEIGLPNLLISLSCPPEILLLRINARNREAEKTIDLKYLLDLNRAIMVRAQKISSDVQVINIDSNKINFQKKAPIIPELQQYIS